MKREKEEHVSIQALNEADLEMVWHLKFKAPDQSYRNGMPHIFMNTKSRLLHLKNDTYRTHPFRQSYMALK
jgi:hypothetical protein